MSQIQRGPTAKNSKATRRDHAQGVAVFKNCSGLGPARPTLATAAVYPFFLTGSPDFRDPRSETLSTATQEAAIPYR